MAGHLILKDSRNEAALMAADGIARPRRSGAGWREMELDRERREFVEAVMWPLGDDPARRALLETAVAIAATVPGTPRGDEAREAIGRMQRTAGRFEILRRLGAGVVLAAAFAGIWLTLAGPAARHSLRRIWDANGTTRWISSLCCGYQGVPSFPQWKRADNDLGRALMDIAPQGIDHESRLLLVGDLSRDRKDERWKAVWERWPQDPAHFHAYALACRRQSSQWPEGFVEIGERLDPGNGWFRLMRGAARMESAIGPPPEERIPLAERRAAREQGKPPPRRKPVDPRERVMKDPAAFAAAWQDLDAALAMPRLDDYRERLERERLARWPAPVDYADHLAGQPLEYLHPEDVWDTSLLLRHYQEGLGLSLKAAAASGDRATLARLEARQFEFARRIAPTANDAIRTAILRRILIDGSRHFAEAWAVAGDIDRGRKHRLLLDHFEADKRAIRTTPADALTENRGSNLLLEVGGFASQRSPDSPPVTEEELRGGRLAEHAMYERLMLHAAALLLTIALGFHLLILWLGRKEHGKLPGRLAGLLDGRDRLWVAVIGVALPIALYGASTRLPWLEPRAYSLSQTGFLMWLAQVLATVLSILLGTLQALRWRLGRRGAILALGWVGGDPGRLLVPTALLAIPIAQVLPRLLPPLPRNWPVPELAIASLLAFPLGWLLWQAVGCFAGAEARKLHRAVTLHAATPYVTAALMLFAMALPLVHGEEKRWTARIDFEALRPGNSAFTPRLERERATWMTREAMKRAGELEKDLGPLP